MKFEDLEGSFSILQFNQDIGPSINQGLRDLLDPLGYHLSEFFLLRPPPQIHAVLPLPPLADLLFHLWRAEGTVVCATRGYSSDVLFPQLLFRCHPGVSLVCNKVPKFFRLHCAIFDIHEDVSLDNGSSPHFP